MKGSLEELEFEEGSGDWIAVGTRLLSVEYRSLEHFVTNRRPRVYAANYEWISHSRTERASEWHL